SHSSKTTSRTRSYARSPREEEDSMNCIAFLTYDDTQGAIHWLETAFGFERASVHDGPDGAVVHAELRFGDGMIMLGPSGPNEFGLRTPRELGAGSQGVYVIVGESAAS